MRKLELQDAFKVARIIKKINSKEMIKDIYQQVRDNIKANMPDEQDGQDEETGTESNKKSNKELWDMLTDEAGFIAVISFIEKAPECENDIYELLGGLLDDNVQNGADIVKHMGFEELKAFVAEVRTVNNIGNCSKAVTALI